MRRIWMTEKRLQKGLKQFELAEKCGVTNRTISNIETGRRTPSGSLAKKIADVLDCDMELFFEDSQTA